MICGVGVDLVDVPRFARIVDRLGEGFLERLFTPAEIDAGCRARRPSEYFAACFAAREAALKALGTGLAGAMSWKDIEVRPANAGTFTLGLSGAVQAAAAALRVRRVHVALSTTRELAAASVVLEN